jgi:predicted nucleic acid-binding protein
MILADTSVWIDHFHAPDGRLQKLLEDEKTLIHPFVIGEIALGNLRRYDVVMGALTKLPSAVKASEDNVLHLIRGHRLQGSGIGYVDAHLVASVLLTPGARLWTSDKRLAQVARTLGVAHRLDA